MVFPIQLLSSQGLVFCLVNENSLNSFRTCPAMFFKFALPFDHVFRFK